MKRKITLITTGGTIDGANLDAGALRPVSELRKWIENDPCIDANCIELCNKDSREITNKDRIAILELIIDSQSNEIVIGHGTYTICETGRFLKSEIPRDSKKLVILVGAWVPLGEPNSDAPEQIRFALAKLKDVGTGVFIAMDGYLWNPDCTEKEEILPGRFALVEKTG